MGFVGDERTTRRAVAVAKAAYRARRRRTYRPRLPEPRAWLQFDWAEMRRWEGARRTCSAAGWPGRRYRAVLPTWDRRLGTLLACLDATLRRLEGARPTYLLTDNERTVTRMQQ